MKKTGIAVFFLQKYLRKNGDYKDLLKLLDMLVWLDKESTEKETELCIEEGCGKPMVRMLSCSDPNCFSSIE